MLPDRIPLWLIPFTSVLSASLALVLGLFVGDLFFAGVLDWFARGSNAAVLTGTFLILTGFYAAHFRFLHRSIREDRARNARN